MTTATVSNKGWIVVPKAYRQKYGLKPGTKVQIVDYGGYLSIIPLADDPIAALHGILADGPSLIDDLLAEHKSDFEKEEKATE